MENKEHIRNITNDVQKIVLMMREALRKDFCAKLGAMPPAAKQQLHERLVGSLSHKTQRHVIDSLCAGNVTCKSLAANLELAQLVDSGAVVQPMLDVVGGMRRSFLSLQTAWEQLNDWCDSACDIAVNCSSEWEMLSSLGILGQPIEIQRRAKSELSPFAIEVARVCASPADTASMMGARQAQASIVPPEGGAAVENLLVLVDPDAPRASRLAVSSMLLKEYVSVVHCRELHMYTGVAMHLSLHAHALFSAVQPPSPGVRKEDLEAHMRRQYLGRAYQCASCRFGPIDHFACGDLAAHNGQRVGNGVISNACPRCGWFSKYLSEWPKWDGTVPEEALLSCARPEDEPRHITAASAEIALRICYSARALWDPGEEGEAHKLCNKLANWETLTAADNVEHLVKLLLALAVADDVSDSIFGPIPMAQLLNEVCARRAEDEMHRIGPEVGRRRVGAFLNVSFFSVPGLCHKVPLGRQREAVLESCRSDYVIDPEAFDFKAWVRGALTPWTHAILFARRVRCALAKRKGGWSQLARDMECGPSFYADVIADLQKPMGSRDTPGALLGIHRKEDAQRVLATMAAQAFLHPSPQSRRTKEVGGMLEEPLGDVREEQTLRGLCIELRMWYYDEILIAKVRSSEKMRNTMYSHVHGLNKQQFWELWNLSYGEDAFRFLASANESFVNRHGMD